MKKSYLVVIGKIHDIEKVNRYRSVAGPIMKKYGGKMPPMNYTIGNIYAGEIKPTFMLQIEFPSTNDINNALTDKEYIKIISDRDEGFADLCIFCITQK